MRRSAQLSGRRPRCGRGCVGHHVGPPLVSISEDLRRACVDPARALGRAAVRRVGGPGQRSGCSSQDVCFYDRV